jgi:anthranilate phosphoribosyltransferase
MRMIMRGEVPRRRMIGGDPDGLRVKGETIGEIAGAAQVMRDLSPAWRCPTRALRRHRRHRWQRWRASFNISTASMFVRRRGRARRSPSTAIAACPRSRAAPMCSKPLGAAIVAARPTRWPSASPRPGVGFMFAPATTAR